MPFNINDIRSSLSLDGSRPTMFMVEIVNPFNNSVTLQTPLLVKAASMPVRNLGVAEVPYFGRPIKLAGDATYDPWQVVILNDEDFLLKNAFEQWTHAINSPTGNIRANPGLGYKSNATVTQFAKTGDMIRQYTMNGIFPIQVGGIQLDWGATNRVEEFGVVFSVDFWEPIASSTGDGGISQYP